ncbi:MAG: SufE family protein [Dehalococcoidia bacterium]|nr:SufE family protein [Dehalococcoidia bacterium]
MTTSLPPRLAEIVEEFQLAQGREKLELLLEFANTLPPLPDWLQGRRDAMDHVHECMTPVFVFAERRNGLIRYHFDIPPDAPTVRGYAAVLAEGLRDLPPETILSVPTDFYQPMGLASVISHQRLNGMIAMMAHLKRLAVDSIDPSPSPAS